MLNERLRELRDAGIVGSGAEGGYELTAEGTRLLDALAPLDAWARRWGARAERT